MTMTMTTTAEEENQRTKGKLGSAGAGTEIDARVDGSKGSSSSSSMSRTRIRIGEHAACVCMEFAKCEVCGEKTYVATPHHTIILVSRARRTMPWKNIRALHADRRYRECGEIGKWLMTSRPTS